MIARALPCAVVAIVAFAERASASCSVPIPEELLLPGIVLEAYNTGGIGAARPGGLVWFETLDEGDTPGCNNLRVNVLDDAPPNEDPVGDPVDITVERVGPHYGAFRLPIAVEAGTRINVSVTCDNGTEIGGAVPVLEAISLEPPPLSFDVVDVEQLTWTEPPCNDTGPFSRATETTNHRALIDVELGDDVDASRAIVLDAWLVAPGASRPDDGAQRVTDALIIPPGLSAFRIYVHTPGAFDVHLRLTDALTGATSDVAVASIDTPPSTGGSCTQASPSSTACAALLVGFALSRRRRRPPEDP